MTFLNKDQILKADDIVTEGVDVPEWGGRVRLKTLTGEERDKFESSQIQLNKKGQPSQNLANLRARLVALVAVDGAGEPLFSQYDVPDLGRKSAKALDRLFDKAQEMNGFSDDDVEKLTEGFDSAPREDSTSV